MSLRDWRKVVMGEARCGRMLEVLARLWKLDELEGVELRPQWDPPSIDLVTSWKERDGTYRGETLAEFQARVIAVAARLGPPAEVRGEASYDEATTLDLDARWNVPNETGVRSRYGMKLDTIRVLVRTLAAHGLRDGGRNERGRPLLHADDRAELDKLLELPNPNAPALVDPLRDAGYVEYPTETFDLEGAF